MLKNLNATNKGLITGLVMIGITLGIFYSGQSAASPLQYLVHIVYAAGIAWTIYEYSRSAENTNKFGAFFLQGFKCFIVITLLMVIFTIVFNKLHPEFKEILKTQKNIILRCSFQGLYLCIWLPGLFLQQLPHYYL